MKSNKPFFTPLDEQLELGFLLIMFFSIISAWKDWWHGGNGYLHMSIFCLITLLRMLYYKYVDVWLNTNNILTKPKIMSNTATDLDELTFQNAARYFGFSPEGRSDEFKKLMVQNYSLRNGWISEDDYCDNVRAIFKNKRLDA